VFTGLIEDVGRLHTTERRGPSARLTIATKLGPPVLGESIAVDGACLTVDAFRPLSSSPKEAGFLFEADCSAETLARTTLGSLSAGTRVHLERALPVGGRLGGHFVAGHVDGLATLTRRENLGEALRLVFATDDSLARFLVEKGSVALAGVSLTVNEVDGARFSVVLIPHSQRGTLLAEARPGDRMNLETDLLARYVARLLGLGGQAASSASHDDPLAASSDDSLLTKLRGSGYL
jgi:riboflavin synthase